jgi:hypothetical protein
MIKHILVIAFCFLCLVTIGQINPGKILQRLIDRDEAAEFEKIDSFRTLHVMLAGNIYQTADQIKYAYDKETRKYDFGKELKCIQPILNLGDITIANLKTSFTGQESSPYSSPDELALALKYSGVNTLLTANFNTANIDKEGLMRTQKLLNQMDIVHTGSYVNNIDRNGNCPLVLFRRGFKIAVLNYSVLNNRPSVSRDFIINTAEQRMIETDLRSARMQAVDFTLVYFDWGSEMQDLPSYGQQQLARFCYERGAGLVVGVHPNAVMHMEYVPYYYNAEPQEGLVVYSLGNLIGSGLEPKQRSGIILDIELRKNNYTGKTHLGDYGFIPIWNYYDTTSSQTGVYSLPAAAIADNQVFTSMPQIEKRRAANIAFDMRNLLGVSSDEIQYNVSDIVVNNVDETVHLINASLNNKLSVFKPDQLNGSSAPAAKLPPAKQESDTTYFIQFYAMKKLIPLDTNYYEHLKGFHVEEENGYYIYLIGNTSSLDKIQELWLRVFRPRYKQSFIVAYVNGRRSREITQPSLKRE